MTAVSQRVFLTQSSLSRSAEAATATPTLRLASGSGTATGRTQSTTPTASSNNSAAARSHAAAKSRTATTAESVQRMATERQRRTDGVRLLARLERASSDMVGYGRRRFVDICAAEEASSGLTPRIAALGVVSKCTLSPYATVAMETADVVAAVETPRPGSAERRAGQQRARLMNELRLRQAEQSVRYRHDRTAQELAQEGALTSRCRPAAGGYPWPRAYKYTPFPQPSVARWLATERRRVADAAHAVEAAEAKAEAEAKATQTEEAAALIELAIQAPVELELPALMLLPGDSSSCDHWQQQRKSSDSLLRPTGLHLAPAGSGGIGKWQRSKSQAVVQKHQRGSRLFSVSTIGEEERSKRRTQLQTLAQVCQRLRDRRASGAGTAVELTPAASDVVDQLVGEIECAAIAGQLYRPGDADGDQLPQMPCPSSEEKSRQHLTRVWLRRHRVCGARSPPIIS